MELALLLALPLLMLELPAAFALLLLLPDEVEEPCINDIDTLVCLLGPATAISSKLQIGERILCYVLVVVVVTEN